MCFLFSDSKIRFFRTTYLLFFYFVLNFERVGELFFIISE
ncbi:hypothetical protein NC99_08050 [Sunxiuqinia dokdonensis]|uniref:Uncharacterized protein n=1 Tax=Sunxiuqinia dokdonensis TaxID=1409788 RepID=A0A0L8VD34_9BACT|nr:hypothetical protein NC99_08050 [Sunxiuqinia dokdonensis]